MGVRISGVVENMGEGESRPVFANTFRVGVESSENCDHGSDREASTAHGHVQVMTVGTL